MYSLSLLQNSLLHDQTILSSSFPSHLNIFSLLQSLTHLPPVKVVETCRCVLVEELRGGNLPVGSGGGIKGNMDALDHDHITFDHGGPIKDPTHIIKGKRTKRQRPQSPIPFTIAAAHDSSSTINTIYSPATSNDFPTGSAATDEDEDTALCLILLSKGFSQQPPKVENDEFAVYKFNSKRYLQEPTTAASWKAGIYVYECKTCSRTFPTFQALGGHRASHKKPKTAIPVEQKKKPLMVLSDEEEQPPPAPPQPPPPQESVKRNSSSSSLSLQLGNSGNFTSPNKSPKFHECSICGAEFNSGQALGGHMRRHRVPGGTTTISANPTLSCVPSIQIEIEIEDDKKSRNDGLCLDLNLLAPDDHDHHRDSKFAISPKQQQQQKQSALVLSTIPTLVDCHY